MTKVALVGGALVLGFGLAACGGSSDTSGDTSAADATASAQIGGADIAAGGLPANWPSDVPQPPGTTVAGGAGSDGSYSASFTGSGSLDSALDTYFADLKTNGWTQDTTVDAGKNLSGWDKDNRRLQVVSQEKSDGTFDMNVTVVTKKS